MGTHNPTVRTTVGIDASLLAAADRIVRTGRFRSRGELLEAALRREILRLEDEEIDRQIRAMADDPEALAEETRVAGEFERSDWEAFQLAEGREPARR